MNEKEKQAKVLEGVGNIALLWSHLEDSVETALCQALGTTMKKGRSVTTYLRVSQQLQALSVLMQARYSDKKVKARVRKMFAKMIKDFDAAKTQRNNAIHSLWTGTKGSLNNPVLVLKRYQSRKSLDSVRINLPLSTILETIKEILVVHASFVSLMDLHFGIDAWRGKFRKRRQKRNQIQGRTQP